MLWYRRRRTRLSDDGARDSDSSGSRAASETFEAMDSTIAGSDGLEDAGDPVDDSVDGGTPLTRGSELLHRSATSCDSSSYDCDSNSGCYLQIPVLDVGRRVSRCSYMAESRSLSIAIQKRRTLVFSQRLFAAAVLLLVFYSRVCGRCDNLPCTIVAAEAGS